MKRLRLSIPIPVASFLLLAATYLVLKLIRPVIPTSVILLYMAFVLAGIVIHITLDDGRMRRSLEFFIPRDGETRALKAQRWGILLVVPLVLALWTYSSLRPSYSPPAEIFQRHQSPPETVEQIPVPEWAADPARWRAEDIARGKALYEANCAICHGKNLDGQGEAATGFRYPIRPASFRDQGTIAQLTLKYVFWRVSQGGIQNSFNSAMPAWVEPQDGRGASSLHSYDLTPEEAWQVIIYLYNETGSVPR